MDFNVEGKRDKVGNVVIVQKVLVHGEGHKEVLVIVLFFEKGNLNFFHSSVLRVNLLKKIIEIFVKNVKQLGTLNLLILFIGLVKVEVNDVDFVGIFIKGIRQDLKEKILFSIHNKKIILVKVNFLLKV